MLKIQTTQAQPFKARASISKKKLTQVYSHYPCDKSLMERFFKAVKDLFRWGTGAIKTGCSS